MVDAPAPIMCKGVPEVVPIGVLHAIRVKLTKHISESPASRVTIRFACVNVKIRIVHAVIRMVNIDRPLSKLLEVPGAKTNVLGAELIGRFAEVLGKRLDGIQVEPDRGRRIMADL